MRRLCFAAVCCALAALSQTLATRSFGGSGSDALNAVATDQAGNVYVAGTASSFDLPLRNAWQGANSGTQLAYSTDSGATWMPLANLVPVPEFPGSIVIAADADRVFAGYQSTVFRSTDRGKHFSSATLPDTTFQTSITSFAIDPRDASVVYASASVNGGVFRSVDGGESWVKVSNGLPESGFINSLAMDPFDSQALWAWSGAGAWVSRDGAQSWTSGVLTASTASPYSRCVGMVFDRSEPGVMYCNTLASGLAGGFAKSADGGTTWAMHDTPFVTYSLTADPVRAGVLYAVSEQTADRLFYRSADGGATWKATPFPGSNSIQTIAVDPANPFVILAGAYRSTDGGETWSLARVARPAQPVFAGAGVVYASVPISTDAVIMKYSAGSRDVAWATYFGGMGDESVAGAQLDPAGNLWVAGTTNSLDLPVTASALQPQLNGDKNLFLAEFSPDGRLIYATYLGGAGTDVARAFAIGSDGNLWLTAVTSSVDYPRTAGTPPPTNRYHPSYATVTQINAAQNTVSFSAFLPLLEYEAAPAIAVDRFGDAVVAGSTRNLQFPVSDGAYHSDVTSALPRAFVIKFDSAGNTVFSTIVGGSTPAGATIYNTIHQQGASAVATDSTGTIYVAGSSSMTDYPVTDGAFQGHLRDECAYPSYSIWTGMIGTLTAFYRDDVFLTKLSADGSALLASSLLGGGCHDFPSAIAITPSGRIAVVGETNSPDFPVRASSEEHPAAYQYKSFVSILDPSLTVLDYSTYLLAGKNAALAASRDGTLYVAGSTGALAQTASSTSGPLGPATVHTQASLSIIE